MKISINYCSTKHYDKNNIIQWIWSFRRYKYVKGFRFRIFGVYVNVRENNAFEKLIGIAQNENNKKNSDNKF